MTQPIPQDFAPPPEAATPPPAPPSQEEPVAPAPAASMPPSAQPPKVGLDALKSIAPDQMTAAYKAGDLAFHAADRVPIRLADGGLATVPATSLAQAVDQGAEIVHPDVVHHAELEAKYGDATGAAGAGLAGFARGLSIGLSDPIALATAGALGGDEAKESLRERLGAYKELHPIATTIGEFAGVAPPALLSGGAAAIPEGAGLGLRAAGTVARGLGLAGEGVSAVGRLAESAAARAVAGIGGEAADSLAVRAAQAALGKGTAGAAEGTIFGAGQGVSEASLGDPNASGEKVWATIGHDAVLGALMGGASGAALGAGGEAAGDALASVRAKASPYLRAKGEDEAFRSLNGRKLYTTQAEKIPGGVRGIGRTMLDDVGLVAGDTIDTIAPKVDAALEHAGDKITAEVSKVGDATVTLKDAETALEERAKEFDAQMGHEAGARAVRDGKTQLRNIFAPFEAATEGTSELIIPPHLEAQRAQIEAVAQAARKPGGEEAAQALEGMGVKFGAPKKPVPFDPEKVKIPLADLLKQRRLFESTVDFQREGSVITNGKRAVGRTLEDLIVERGEQAAKEAGVDFAAPYKAAKLKWRQLRVASDAVNDAVTRAESNAAHSLTDKMFGAAGAAAGLASHGPAGLVTGLATQQASKFIRTRANATLATWFDKLSTLQAIARRTDQVDAQLDKGVASFLKRVTGGAEEAQAASPARSAKLRASKISKSPKESDDPREQYAARAAAVEAAAKTGFDPLAKELAQHAPQTAAVVAQRAASASTWLASQIPPPPKFGSKTPSDQQIYEFNAKFQAVAHPVETLSEGLATGALTKIQVDAVKATAPTIVDQVVKQIDARLQASLKDDQAVPYATRRDLAMLFGIDLDWSQTQQGAAALQKNAADPLQSPKPPGNSGSGGPAPGPMGGPKRAVKTPSATLMQSDTERRQGGSIR